MRKLKEMHLFSSGIFLTSVLITLCNSQSYSRYSYPVQRRAGYSYTQPYYNRQNAYYPSTTNRNTVRNSVYPATTNSYYQQTPQRNYKQTSSTYYPSNTSKGSYYSAYNQPSRGSYNQKTSSISTQGSYRPSTSINRNSAAYSSRGSYNPYQPQSTVVNRNAIQTSSSTGAKGSYNSASDPIPNKQYLTNSYNTDNKNTKDTSAATSSNTLPQDSKGKYRVSKADTENAKFAGADNQENEEDARTLHLKRRKFRRRLGALASPCFPYGRDAGNAGTPPPKEQGRFLWDVNVVNVYPQAPVGFAANSLGCGGGIGGFGGGGYGGGLAGLGGIGGLGGGLGGGGLLSDPISQPYYPPGTGLVNFLSLFAPGVLQNSLAVTARPQLYSDPIQTQNINNSNVQSDDLQSDPEVDPNYSPQQVAQPVRRPNRIYYDSAGAAPVTPGQLLGGVSTTVNGIIQQLTGNVQPVYG